MLYLTAIGMFLCFAILWWEFTEVDVINGNGLVEKYLVRRTLWRWYDRLAVYVHHFVEDDWSMDLHSHPKWFISIGLRGEYIEEDEQQLPNGVMVRRRTHFKAPWIRFFPASHEHRLMLRRDEAGEPIPCWTLVIVGRIQQNWGYWLPFTMNRKDLGQAAEALAAQRLDGYMPQRFRLQQEHGATRAWAWIPWDRYVYNRKLAASRTRQ